MSALLLGSDSPTADDARSRREQRAAAALLDPPRSLGAVAPTAELGSLPATTRRLTAAYDAYFALRKTPPQLQPLTGVGIGHGAYRGRAVVARCADEASAKLEPGDILVTTLTTPALSSVLAVCGALVVEEAGILSHAAVMARELDLVAVVGVLDATALITDGADIEVDAVAGVVRVLGP